MARSFLRVQLGFWVMALEAGHGETVGKVTLSNHSKGSKEASRGSAQTRAIHVLSETPKT